jgi:hypothetical protein
MYTASTCNEKTASSAFSSEKKLAGNCSEDSDTAVGFLWPVRRWISKGILFYINQQKVIAIGQIIDYAVTFRFANINPPSTAPRRNACLHASAHFLRTPGTTRQP